MSEGEVRGSDFSGRDGAVLVSGGSGGLGAAIVAMLAARGARVVCTYRHGADAAEALIDSLGADAERVRARALDLADEAACRRLVTEVAAEYGGVHTLVHAAGPHVPMVHLSRVAPADLAAQLDADVNGFFALVSATLPHLRTAAAAGDASIVAVTTAATARYPVRDALSAIPKGAVEQLVRAVAAEEGRYGVRANCVGPGMLTDGMAARLIDSGELDETALAITRGNIPLRRFGAARDVAEAVCFLASDRAGFVSGQKLDVDGGYGV